MGALGTSKAPDTRAFPVFPAVNRCQAFIFIPDCIAWLLLCIHTWWADFCFWRTINDDSGPFASSTLSTVVKFHIVAPSASKQRSVRFKALTLPGQCHLCIRPRT